MSQITIKDMDVFVNNRFVITARKIKEIKKISNGRFIGNTYNDQKIVIYGGKDSGGSKNEWFVSLEGVFNDLQESSISDCIKLIESA